MKEKTNNFLKDKMAGRFLPFYLFTYTDVVCPHGFA